MSFPRPYVASPLRYDSGMPYRRTGRSGLRLPAISLGLWQNFGGQDVFETGRAILRRAFDRGVTHFDLANNYGPPYGSAEENFGRVLASDFAAHRDELIISTKAGWDMWPGPYGDVGSSKKYLIASCDQSLKRMGLDYVDIFYSHRVDAATPLEETMAALNTLVSHGKVRYVGCSNYSGWQVMKGLGISDLRGHPRFVTQQIHYTLEAREAEYELLPISVDQGLGILVWSPLAGGLLSGRYGRDEATARHLGGWTEPPIRDQDRLWRIVDVLKAVGTERGVSAAQVALAWLLGRPAVSSLVIGGRNEAQFRDNLAAATLVLSEEERTRLDVVSKPPVLYPYWHQQNSARDRFGPADLVMDRS